jgi:Zn-dependent protease
MFFFISAVPGLQELGAWGFQINLLFALFNLLPFPPLDGSKVISWNPMVWFITIAVSAVLFFFPKVLISLF